MKGLIVIIVLCVALIGAALYFAITADDSCAQVSYNPADPSYYSPINPGNPMNYAPGGVYGPKDDASGC